MITYYCLLLVESVNERVKADTHRVLWNGTNMIGQSAPSSVYFCQIKSDNFIETKKLVLLK